MSASQDTRRIPTIASAATIAVGAIVLVGWVFGIPALTAVIAGRATMKPNTAVCFILAGLSLWLGLREHAGTWRRRVARGAAMVLILVGLVTVAEYAFGWTAGIDSLLFEEPPGAPLTPYPGRMGVHTAVCFCLLGGALLGLRACALRARWIAEGSTVAVVAVAVLAFVEHLFSVPSLTDFTVQAAQMAVHTAALFLVVSAGVLAALPDGWIREALTSDGPGGTVARRLVPVVFGVMLVVSWLRLKGQQIGLYGTEFGVAVVAAAGIVTLTVAVLWIASVLNRTDTERREQAAVLQEHAPVIDLAHMIVRDLDGLIRVWNKGAEHLYGWTRAEAVGRVSDQLLRTEFPESLERINEQLLSAGHWEGELVHHRRDGSSLVVASHWVLQQRGEQERTVLEVNNDITPRKRAEARTLAVVESSPTGMVMVDGAGKIVMVNRAIERMFGYSREELLGRSIELLVPHRMGERHPGFRAEFFANPQARAMGAGRDLFGVRKDGTEIPVEIGLNPIETDEGMFVLASVVDITERKLADAMVRETEERLRFALQRSHTGGWDLDLRDNTAHRTLEHDRIFGYESLLPQWTYQMFLEHVVPEDRAEVDRRFHAAVEGQTDWNFECRIHRTDGEVRWIWAAGGHQRDGKGPARRLAGIVQDITDRKRAEQELRRSNEELERFAYVASHDLQEPLRMVGSYVQLLSRRYTGKLDADADKFIAFALDGSLRMKALIDDLLAFSRVGTQGAAPAPTDAGAALDTALANLELAIAESKASVTRDPLPTVLADPGQLRHLFLNLVSNALKFRGGEPPRVHVSATASDGEWRFSVRDNGIGIAPEYFARIFVIFQRLHTRAEYPGTGIGLAIARKIVERHGGRIWVESAPGRGTTFFFTLPKQRERA